MSESPDNAAVILASASPRRKYLLRQAGLAFTVEVSRVDESAIPWSAPRPYTRTLAEAKAAEVADRHPDAWIIGADTIVVAGGQVLEKPGSRDEARQMLTRLSGAVHEVYTGYAVLCRRRHHHYADTVRTEVQFKELTAEEIEWYIHTREPYDKAGAYAIQENGEMLIESVTGS
ncbi:MAG: Maf family protein, partial [Desulfosudaceae bacterium]